MDVNVRNIFCIGRNYAMHAKELGNAVPDKPIVFSKPTHALVLADGQDITYPRNQGEIHHELEIVLVIGKDVVEPNFQVDEVVAGMALGVDMTLRDVQSQLKQKGHPWLLAKGFKHSAILTDIWDFPGEAACGQKDFSLRCDGALVQKGNIAEMLFPFHTLLTYVQAHFGLRRGDIIYTGTPKGVGPIKDNVTYELFWGDERKGSFAVRWKD